MTQFVANLASLGDAITSMRIVQLAHPMSSDFPQRPGPPAFRYRMIDQHGDPGTLPHQLAGSSAATDEITVRVHSGTHIDSLGHIAMNDRLFGGGGARQSQDPEHGVRLPGRESISPIVARAALYDFARLHGVSSLPGDYVITVAELERCAAEQDVHHRPGDVVLFRTGWDTRAVEGGGFYSMPCPGPDTEVARLLATQGIAATGSDTFAYESAPGLVPLSPHVELIANAGVYILEMLDLRELADLRCTEFIFVAAPLRITGGTGSPINPLALVHR